MLDQWSQMQVLQRLIRFARKNPREQLKGVRHQLEEMDWYWKVHKPGNDRTTYVIGLFDTRVHGIESRRQLAEHLVHHGPDLVLLLIYPSHAFS
jgi:hypothetical protein